MHLTTTSRPRRSATGLVTAVAALALLAGCSPAAVAPSANLAVDAATPAAATPAPVSTEPVTIEYFNFTAGADHEADLQAIIDGFRAENPTITIKAQNAPYDEYFTSLKTRMAGNTAPDTFELNYENFVSFAASGALLDLEASAPGTVDKTVYFPKAYDAFNYEGVQLGVPESFSVVVLIYNKDLFDKAGVDYPTADWTWADESAAATKLTDAAKGVYGEYQPVQFFEFYKSLAQSGGQFFNDDMSAATFNSEAGIAAATHLVEKVGTTMPTEAQMGGIGDDVLFQQGKIAMWHNGIWAVQQPARYQEQVGHRRRARQHAERVALLLECRGCVGLDCPPRRVGQVAAVPVVVRHHGPDSPEQRLGAPRGRGPGVARAVHLDHAARQPSGRVRLT